jgi:mannan endo-1,4-beta-mannosidase
VWNVNAPNGGNAGPIESYYPGAQFADMVTMDIYGEFKEKYYTSILALAGEKPIALGEVGGVPSPEILQKQPRWTYFMCWSEFVQKHNSVDLVNAVYHAPQVLTREDARLALPLATIRKGTAERLSAASEAIPGVSPAPAH